MMQDTDRAKKIGQRLLLFGKDDDVFVTFCQAILTALKSCFTTSRSQKSAELKLWTAYHTVATSQVSTLWTQLCLSVDLGKDPLLIQSVATSLFETLLTGEKLIPVYCALAATVDVEFSN